MAKSHVHRLRVRKPNRNQKGGFGKGTLAYKSSWLKGPAHTWGQSTLIEMLTYNGFLDQKAAKKGWATILMTNGKKTGSCHLNCVY